MPFFDKIRDGGTINMYFPVFPEKGDLLGVCAPSAGVGHKLELFDQSVKALESQGYRIKETAHVRVEDARGGTAEERANELVSLFDDPDIKAVLSAAGGDFLYEILPFINWNRIKRNPKWMAGASDPTSILFTLTTKYDIASLYGFNAGSFDETPLSPCLKDALNILKGKLPIQKTSRLYASKPSFADDYVGPDTPTQWHSNKKDIHTTGRCIGGCMDVLKDLIGTPFDNVKSFVRRYKEDGIIWYFDNFSLSAENFYRTLLQMKYAGWFEYARAVIIGRVLFPSSETGMTYEEAILRAMDDLPVISEADIGHTVPSFTMINGAVMELSYRNGKGKIKFTLR